jgi:hypothetical protein
MNLNEIIAQHYMINCGGGKSGNINLDYISNFIDIRSDRYLHIKGVAETMLEIINKVPGLDDESRKYLLDAAYLHDIGYSEKLKKSGFHPLDGAIFAFEKGFNELIVKSILFHTGSRGEAEIRGGALARIYTGLKECVNEHDKFFLDMI